MDVTHDDECGMAEAVPWLTLAAAGIVGFSLTAGWLVRTAWAVAHNPAAWNFLTHR